MLPSPRAWSAPGDGGAVSDSPTLALADLGSSAPLAFYGQQGTETLTFPVVAGQVPAALNALVEVPVNLRSAVLTVGQDERTISRIEVPLTYQAPIVIPLEGAEIVDNAVTVTLRSYLVPVEGYCLDPTNPLRLVDGTVSLTGVETPPATVADFLPPVLRKLTIAIPDAPSQAESDSAVRLATSVVAHYGDQNVEVAVVGLGPNEAAPADPSAPLERLVMIRQGPDSGLSLRGGPGVPALSISGPANELVNQTRLLSTDIARLAQASKAIAGPLKSSPQLPGDTVTLRDLGQPGITAVALAPQVNVALDQTRLGRAARDVRVHLVGSYTPVPQNIGAQLVAQAGGETIDRWASDASGRIDRWVSVPDRLLRRYTNLGIAVNITGNTGRCGEFQPITLTIDGDSVVQSSLANPPVPQGFQSLPQALMPRVQVGIGKDAFADTVRAVSIMVGLQRLSALPFDTAVTGLQQAIDDRNPAVLLAADGWTDDGIKLPLAAAGGRLAVDGVDDGGKATTLTLEPALRFGSLQTVVEGGRSLLIATSNGAPAQLDELLSWLNANPRRWDRLDGGAVIAAPGRAPVTVPVASAPQAPTEANSGSALMWWIGGGVLAVVAVGVALILLRSRGKPRAG